MYYWKEFSTYNCSNSECNEILYDDGELNNKSSEFKTIRFRFDFMTKYILDHETPRKVIKILLAKLIFGPVENDEYALREKYVEECYKDILEHGQQHVSHNTCGNLLLFKGCLGR